MHCTYHEQVAELEVSRRLGHHHRKHVDQVWRAHVVTQPLHVFGSMARQVLDEKVSAV
jgi:hypothetical protein